MASPQGAFIRFAPFFCLTLTDDTFLTQPLLWHHSIDPLTLRMDEDFLFGSHVLVASVTEKAAINKIVYLPGVSNNGEKDLRWCELDTGVWHEAGRGRFVELGTSFRSFLLPIKGN
jgi:alpha-glucosidase (family GH31 glycosyl hydrolase)